ncbi:MAG: TIR domain-containing protein [Symploca sp. SIO2E6]|nr:TIR domain-containing protein [Symploca sp. SIO2E6]
MQLFDAFISYGRADSKAFAIKLQSRLEEQGFQVWFDFNDIPLGVDFQNQIDDGIEKARQFLFVIAPHSVNSPYCGKEIELAINCHKRIIPLLHVEQISRETWQQRNSHGTAQDWEAYKAKGLHSSFPNMHPAISKINWVYFREGIDDFNKSLADLIKLLISHTDYVEPHTKFLLKALEWERQQKQTRYLLTGEEKQQAQSWLKIRFKKEQPPCTPGDLHCEYITESIKNSHNWMTQVFLSYATQDKAIMEKIRNSLRRESITVWTNLTDIQTGEDFGKAINRGIEQADNLVYLLSPESINSTYCQQELDLAVSLNKRIIPLLVKETEPNTIPEVLQQLQYIDLTDNVKEEDYRLDESQLLKILQEDEAYYYEHKMLLTKALKWEHYKNPSLLLRGYNRQSAESWLKVAQKRKQHPPTQLQEEFIAESLQQPPLESLAVFISYSRADSDLARKLNDSLQMQGKTTWFDQETIASDTEDFQQEMSQGIKACDNFLFILSPHSVNSADCQEQVEYAASLNKRLVTVLYRQVNPADVPPELAKVQQIDFNQKDFNANFNELVRTLDIDREHVRSHTKWLQRALEWQEKGKNNDLLLRESAFAIAQNWLQEAQQQNKQPAVTPLHQEYITKSNDAILAGIKREKRQKLILQLLLALATVGLLGAGIEYLEVQKHSSITKATLVKNLLETNPLKALVRAIEATGTSKSLFNRVPKEVQSSLFEAVQVAREGVIERDIFRVDGAYYVLSVAISPDGQIIASGNADGQLQLWDLKGNLIAQSSQRQKHGINSIAFSPDGKTIVGGSADKTLRLWDLKGEPIGKPFTGHQNSVTSVAISPDGKTIVSGSWDKTVRLWDLKGEPIAQPFTGHKSNVTSVAFSPDGKTIVSGSWDNTVQLWDLKGEPIGKPFTGHKSNVTSVAFSPDGETIVSGSWDNTVRLWDLKGEPIAQPFTGRSYVTSVAFSPDGKTVVSGDDDNTVWLWELNGNPIGQPFKGHEGFVTSVALSPDGETIISGSEDSTVRLWDLKSYQTYQPIQKYDESVTSVAFSPDGKYIISGCYDGKVRLSNEQGNLIGKPFQGHKEGIRSVAFSPDGKIIASGSDDKTVRLWDLKGNPIGQPLQGHQGIVYSVAFSPDGQRIASGAKDKTIRLWDLKGNPIGQPFQGHQEEVRSVVFSPDGKTIASASRDQTIRLWDLKGNPIRKPFQSRSGRIWSVSFSSDGQTLVSGNDGTVQLWDLEGNPIGKPFQGHQGAVYSVAFSPDKKAIVSSSQDNTLRLWDLNGKPISEPIKGHKGGVWSVAFSPDGQSLVSGSWDYTMRLWPGGTSWKDWFRMGCNRLQGNSVVSNPQTGTAKKASTICQKYAPNQDKNRD